MTVNYANQIIDSLKASVVERILVVDDAYDPPPLSKEHEGELLDVLQRPELRDYVTEDSLGEHVLQSAIAALTEGESDHGAVRDAVSALFDTYVHQPRAEVDPGGVFGRLKDLPLRALDPLLELLGRCGDSVSVRRAGTDAALRVRKDLKPDLILMDFFLSPPDRSTGASTRKEQLADRKSSIALLTRILQVDDGVEPAVILMSSGEVEDRAQRYFDRLEGRVTALRFGFLNKTWIQRAGGDVVAVDRAADVLADTSGSLGFGRTLEAALRQWRRGAEAGLNELYSDLRDLHVKDFAYLLRFRLYEEGVSFADYLEWFLGESLRAVVDDKVQWHTEEFSRLNEEELTEGIEGAHPAPSPRIARFFHRMRFDDREKRGRERFSLGDLFIEHDGSNVRMVITPDCDLIERRGRRRASRFLTVGGTIHRLGDENALAGHLILDRTPKALTWNLKDVASHDFNGTSELRIDESAYSYYATMRPLVAQAIQKDVLGDLARVGSAVPPTVDVGAPVKVYVKMSVGNRPRVVELLGLDDAQAQVFMPRGGSERELRALFTKRFVRALVARLEEIDSADLFPNGRKQRNKWFGNATEVHKSMWRDGVRLPSGGLFGMFASAGNPRGKGWLEIVVDVSDDALMNRPGSGPLTP